MRYFNTAGPCVPELHYMVPPGPRLPEARPLRRGSVPPDSPLALPLPGGRRLQDSNGADRPGW